MSKLFKLPIRVNKSNGQFTTYIKQGQLSQKVLDAIKQQPGACKKLLFEFKGVEND